MLVLYPEIKPYSRHRLKVDEPHELYIEECGNPNGVPVLYLHGGPGLGVDCHSRRFFDPERYRIILFDQRGAGKSTPQYELDGNHTEALVEDIEKIRQFLRLEKWVLFGGSWGSTLALVYAEAHPLRVMAMILRGIFLAREQDLRWFYAEGANRLFPDHWEDFIHPIPLTERRNLIEAYHRRLSGSNELARMAAAKSWALWEAQCATLRPNHDVVEQFTDPHIAVALARIETHYFVNQAFLEDNQILKNCSKLRTIPGIIVHGRYDAICPLENAHSLHEAWPESQLHIIRDGGHSAFEPTIADALIRATRDIANRFSDEFDRTLS